MKNIITDLENIFIDTLQDVNNQKHQLEKLENEKHDLLIENSIGIIETLDSFDKINEWLVEKELDKNIDSIRTQKRYLNIQNRLFNLLLKYGIKKMEFDNNIDKFGWSEPVETIVDNLRQDNEIVSIVRNGYYRANEVIRPAQVIIIKN
jgi:molecular chaperone GrpE (heat shock protein)